jgi:cytochrome c551/c552
MNLPKWSTSTKAVITCFIFGCCLMVCSSSLLLWSSAPPAPAQAQTNTKNEISEAEMSRMNSDQLAKYVFDHHGCSGCHTLGANGKLGYTERGKQVGKGFIGCVSLLTSMNMIAQVEPANRTTEEKEKAAKFSEFGCTTCHQITPGELGLTSYGAKLKSFHMACTDVERILSSQNHK